MKSVHKCQNLHKSSTVKNFDFWKQSRNNKKVCSNWIKGQLLIATGICLASTILLCFETYMKFTHLFIILLMCNICYYFKIFQKIYLYFSNRYICSCTTYFFPIFIEHYSHCTDRHGKASRFKSSDINKMLLRISDGLGSSPKIGCKTWTNFSSFLCQFFSMFLRILQVLSKITVWHSSLVLDMQSPS